MPDTLNVIAGAAAELGERVVQELHNVYDLAGKLHRMTKQNVIDAVTHLNWSTKPPVVITEAQAAANDAPPVQTQPVAPTTPAAPAAPTEAAKVDLMSMSVEGLARLAKEKFNMDIPETWSHQQILDAIQVEMGV